MKPPMIATMAWIVLGLASQAAGTICIAESITLRRVEGIVIHESDDGATDPLPGAVVEISSGDFEAATTADEDGYFRFGEIRPGNYEIRARLEGFVTALGEVRVRRNSATGGRVLVIGLPIGFDSCGGVTTETYDRARRLQLGKR